MDIRWSLWTCLCVALVSTAAGNPVIAAPPSLSSEITSANGRLTSEQTATVETYITEWAEQLDTGDISKVSEARAALTSPVLSLGVGSGFKSAYAQLALDPLSKVIDNQQVQRAMNAVVVIGVLESPSAVDVLLAHVTAAREDRPIVRAHAALALRRLLNNPSLPQPKVVGALREIGRAAERETNWLTLYRQYNAIVSVRRQDAPDLRNEALKIYRQTLRANIEKLQTQSEPSDLMQAIHRALIDLRNVYIRDLSSQQQNALKRDLAPLMNQLLEFANTRWEQAQSDPEAKQHFGGVIQEVELLMVAMASSSNTTGQTPQTQLRQSWQSKNKPAFERSMQAWNSYFR